MEELSTVRVERDNLRANLDLMTSLVQGMKENFGFLLSTVSMEELKTYDDMINTANLKILEELVGW